MRLGLALPQHRDTDLRRDIALVAHTAEEAGFDSLWVYERLAYPTKPRQDMYDFEGLPWEPAYRDSADPMAVLAVGAAHSEDVRLGSSVLVAGLHKPIQLAKAFATTGSPAVAVSSPALGVGGCWMSSKPRAHNGHGAQPLCRKRSM